MARIVSVRQNVGAVESEIDGYRSEFYTRSTNARISAEKVIAERDKFIRARCVKHGLVSQYAKPPEVGAAWKTIAHEWDYADRKYFSDFKSGQDLRLLNSLIDGAQVSYDPRELASLIDAEAWMRRHNSQLLKKLWSKGHLKQLNPHPLVAAYAYRESQTRREWYY